MIFTNGSGLKRTLDKFVQDYKLEQPMTPDMFNNIAENFCEAYEKEINETLSSIRRLEAAFKQAKSARK